MKLALSLKKSWTNTSLLGVLMLEFIARILVIVVFTLISMAVVIWLNPSLISQGVPVIENALNTRTFIAGGSIAIIEFFVLLYINSFFTAGLIGMLKNVVQDGSTTFNEFLPSAKRYWYAMFRYLLIPYIIITLSILPFIYYFSIFAIAAANGIQVQNGVSALLGTFTLFMVVGALLVFWFSYGFPLLVFEDMDAWQATKASWKLARKSIPKTTGMTVMCIIIMGAAFFIYLSVNVAAAYFGINNAIAQFIEVVMNVTLMIGIIITALYVFFTYDEIAMRKQVRSSKRKA